jgi:hypothetical protein
VAINRETYKVVSELYDIVHGVRDEGSRPKTTPRPLTQDEQKRLMDKAIKQGFEDDALDLIAASAAIRDATKEM